MVRELLQYNWYADLTYLKIGGWGDQYNSLLRFNLSGLPTNATDAAVCLDAFPNGGSPVEMDWYRVTTAWQENTATWSNQPGGVYLGYTTPAGSGWHCITITSWYNSWRNGSSFNYGFKYVPRGNTNQFNHFYSSDDTVDAFLRPTLYVNSTTVENRIVLKWPLATSYGSRVVTHAFGVDWAGKTYCPPGVIKKHNGTDYSATAGTAVYAGEDGWVKHVESHSPWAYHIVIEHNHPSGKYTTVSWHVNPLVSEGQFVPKGMQIATVANLGADTHFHLGIRRAPYNAIVSGVGALPQATCTDPNGTTYPGIPENFINPENTSIVLFQ